MMERAQGYLHGDPGPILWRRIPLFPLYEVSNWGLVRNARTKRVLTNVQEHNSGHARVSIRGYKGARHLHVRFLVAEAFIPGYSQRYYVDTISGNRMDVAVTNLKLSLNVIDRRRRVPVRIVELGKDFESVYAAAQYIHGSSGVITKILNGFGKTHKGFTFQKLN